MKKKIFGMDNSKWTLKEQTDFFQTCSDLLQAGFSIKKIASDLPLLFPQSQDKYRQLEKELLQGKTLSSSLRPFVNRDIADQLWIAEQHGMLLLSLEQLAKFYGQRQRQKEHLQGVLFYPFLLIALRVVRVIMVNYWLKPELIDFQASSNSLNSFNLLMQVLLGIVLSGVGIYFLRVKKYFLQKKYLSKWDWLCQVPVLGKLFREYAYYYLTFNLGLLLKSGLDLQKICMLLTRFDEKSLLFQFSHCLHDASLSGHLLTTLPAQRAFIPPEFRLFFSKGHTSSQLSEELLYFSSVKYQRLLSSFSRLIELIQPIMFILVALVIVSTYLEILLPLYKTWGGVSDENY